VAEKFYRDNNRLLEGGIWAEVTIAYNEIGANDLSLRKRLETKVDVFRVT